MEIAGIIAGLIGLSLLLVGARRERGQRVDVFAALDRLERRDLLRMPVWFWGAAVFGAIGSFLSYAGSQGIGPGITAGLATAIVTWLTWVWILGTYHSIVDLTVAAQDALPLDRRPHAAFDTPAAQAISFRPMRMALTILGTLAAGGIVFVMLAQSAGGWSETLTALSLGFVSAVFLIFGMRIRRSLDAERDVRRILHQLPDVPAADLFHALQENPRSRVLLEMHADRMQAEGEYEQALIEYRAASIGRAPGERLAKKTLAASDAAPARGELDRRRLVLEPYATKPTATIAPLTLPDGSDELELLDPLAGFDTVLSWAEPGGATVMVVVEPPLTGGEARELAPYLVLAPLVLAEGPMPRYLPAYRLGDKVRHALKDRVEKRGKRAFKRVELITTDQVLASVKVDAGTVSIPPGASALYDELRVTASVRARPVEGDVG